jgi:hypothetical protein
MHCIENLSATVLSSFQNDFEEETTHCSTANTFTDKAREPQRRLWNQCL